MGDVAPPPHLPHRFPIPDNVSVVTGSCHVAWDTSHAITVSHFLTRPPPSRYGIIRRFKSFTVGEYRRKIDPEYRGSRGQLWQEGYYDVIVRNERQLDALRRYMANNPRQWEMDTENLEGKGRRG